MEARKDDVDVGGAAGAGGARARAVGLMLPNNKPAKATERESGTEEQAGLALEKCCIL